MRNGILKHIPSYRFDTSSTATPIVGDYSTVRFDKNNYSVPVRCLRKTIVVKETESKKQKKHPIESDYPSKELYYTRSKQLTNFIPILQQQREEPYAIMISGEWGTGLGCCKTTGSESKL